MCEAVSFCVRRAFMALHGSFSRLFERRLKKANWIKHIVTLWHDVPSVMFSDVFSYEGLLCKLPAIRSSLRRGSQPLSAQGYHLSMGKVQDAGPGQQPRLTRLAQAILDGTTGGAYHAPPVQ